MCHWLYTLEWGWSDWSCMLIHHHAKFPFSPIYPELRTKNHLHVLYYTKNCVHCLLTHLVFLQSKIHVQFYWKSKHTKKQNTALLKMLLQRNTKYSFIRMLLWRKNTALSKTLLQTKTKHSLIKNTTTKKATIFLNCWTTTFGYEGVHHKHRWTSSI